MKKKFDKWLSITDSDVSNSNLKLWKWTMLKMLAKIKTEAHLGTTRSVRNGKSSCKLAFLI